MSHLTKAYRINSELVDFLVNREELSDLLEHTPSLVENRISSKLILIMLLNFYIYRRGLSKIFYSSRNLEYMSHFLLNYLHVNLDEEFSQINLEDIEEDNIHILESIVDTHAYNLPSDFTSDECEIVLSLAKQQTPTEFDTDTVLKALSKVELTPQTIVNGKKVINGQFIGADIAMLNELSSTWDGLYERGEIEDPTNLTFSGPIRIGTYNILNRTPEFDEIIDNEWNSIKQYKINLTNNCQSLNPFTQLEIVI